MFCIRELFQNSKKIHVALYSNCSILNGTKNILIGLNTINHIQTTLYTIYMKN